MFQKLPVAKLVTLVILQSYIEPVIGRCDFNCPNNIEYVCGSDMVTYQNDCFLRRSMCETGKTVTVDSEGFCSSTTSSSDCPDTCDGVEEDEVFNGGCDKFKNVCELRQKSCGDNKTKVIHKKNKNCNLD